MTAVVELNNNKHIQHSFHCEYHVLFLLEILQCYMYSEERNAYRVLVGKPEGQGPLGNHGVDRKMLLNYIIIIQGCCYVLSLTYYPMYFV